MLYVGDIPIQVQIKQDHKVIILLNNKIMFTHLDFIEEYLSMNLVTKQPINMYYQGSVMETMVVSERTVELYYCDWKTQIKLVKVICLNEEFIQHFFYQLQTGWHIIGEMRQYQPRRMTFHRLQNAKDGKIIGRCFIQTNKYILTQHNLKKSHKGEQLREVAWKDRMMVLRNCKFSVKMFGSKIQNSKKDVILLNEYEVMITIVEPNVIYFENSLLISYRQEGKVTAIQKYENNEYIEIGIIHRLNGNLCGSYLYQNDLVMLQYDQKQILLKSLPLIIQRQDNSTHHKGHRRKRLFQSISKIMEESHEEGSQLMQFSDKYVDVANSYTMNVNQKDDDLNFKNMMIEGEINDNEIKDDIFNEGDSEVLSRSGNEEQKQALSNIFEKGEENFCVEVLYKGNEQSRKKSTVEKQLQTSENDKTQYQATQAQNLKDEKTIYNQNYWKDKIGVQQIKDKNSGKTVGININDGITQIHRQQAIYDVPDNLRKMSDFSQVEQKHNIEDREWDFDKKEVWNMQFMSESNRLKVEKFKPLNKVLNEQIIKQICLSSYCQLIQKAIQEDSDRLEELMQLFIVEVLKEKECEKFFQRKIRTFNPQFTKDKIRKVFGKIIKKKELQYEMTSALQLFKMSEVPSQVLWFPDDFVKVIGLICKEVRIAQLLKPSQNLIEYILKCYFKTKKFSESIIKIQDEQIDISHPRNMLNILLYLNQVFGLKIEVILKIYCSKLLLENEIQILKKIVINEKIFEICQVSREVLDEVLLERFNKVVGESGDHGEYLRGIVEFMSDGIGDQYKVKLAIICELNRHSLYFDLSAVMKMKESQLDILTFCKKIVKQNSCRNLVNLRLQGIYRGLYWLQEYQKIVHMTNEYIELMRTLGQKFCSQKDFYHGFKVIGMVLPKIKVSFIAKLLYLYLNCKFVNRLVQCYEHRIQSLEEMFPEITKSAQINVERLERDKVKLPTNSNCFCCSWKKFTTTLEKHVECGVQLKILIFLQVNLANEIFLRVGGNSWKKFKTFLAQMKQNMNMKVRQPNIDDESADPKGLTSIKFESNLKNEIHQQMLPVLKNEGHLQHETRKHKVNRSMLTINHNGQDPQKKRSKNLSVQVKKAITNNDLDVFGVRLLVSKNEIIEQLCSIYQQKPQNIFLQSMQLVDFKKIPIYHFEIFKIMVSKQIEFKVCKLLPFQIFLTSQINQAFQLARFQIKSTLTVANFWVVYLIVEFMFNKGDQICKIFIEKCVIYFRRDTFSQPIQQIIRIIKPKLDKIFINQMIQFAKDYNLNTIQKIMKEQKY